MQTYILALLVLACAVHVNGGLVTLSSFHSGSTWYHAIAQFRFSSTTAFKTNLSYVENIGYSAIPIIVVGILAPIIFLIWSCCRCCRCTQCCSAPQQISGRSKIVLTIILLALVITAAVMIFYGFAAATQQTQAFADVDKLLTDVVNWVTDVGTRGGNVNTAGTNVVDQITTLINDDSGNCYDHAALNTLSSKISGLPVLLELALYSL